ALHTLRQLRRRVADVDLAAGDPIRTAVQRQRLGQPGHRMLGRRVGDAVRPRHMRRDAAVVVDAAALRILLLLPPEGTPGATERPSPEPAPVTRATFDGMLKSFMGGAYATRRVIPPDRPRTFHAEPKIMHAAPANVSAAPAVSRVPRRPPSPPTLQPHTPG